MLSPDTSVRSDRLQAQRAVKAATATVAATAAVTATATAMGRCARLLSTAL
jgi:hypothetical protein